MSALPQGSGMILVADDDPAVRDLTGRILKLAGYTPVEAVDGPSAVEAVRRHAGIRLVLLDLHMPGLARVGKTVEWLRELRADLPILVITGFPDSETRERLAGQQVAGLLEKPFQPPELIARIRQTLGEDDDLA